jgi:hypothetical protein
MGLKRKHGRGQGAAFVDHARGEDIVLKVLINDILGTGGGKIVDFDVMRGGETRSLRIPADERVVYIYDGIGVALHRNPVRNDTAQITYEAPRKYRMDFIED